jgi:serine protease AprX
VAPNANLINLRALDANGAGTDSSVIAAIERAIALQRTYNIRVINLSLGRPIYESYTLDPLCQAVEQAWKAGIVVVVAAGNNGRNLNLNSEGYGTINAPGNDPYAITVGAMRSMQTPAMNDDLIASYSSKGPSFIDNVAKPDIVSPGNLVPSLRFGGDPLAKNNPSFVTPFKFYQVSSNSNPSPDYFPLSGTSMATTVTSGAIADLLQARPGEGAVVVVRVKDLRCLPSHPLSRRKRSAPNSVQ